MFPRLLNRTVQVALDVVVLSIAYWLAFLFRFEFGLPAPWGGVLLVTWPYVVLLQFLALAALGVPRMSWRYFSIGDASRVLIAVALATMVLVAVRVVGHRVIDDAFAPVLIPLGVLAINFTIAF